MTRGTPELRSHRRRDREVQRPALLVPDLDPKPAPHHDRDANRAPRDHTRACLGRDLPMTNVNDVRRGTVGQGRSVRRAPAAGARPAAHSGEDDTPPHPSDATPSAFLDEPVKIRAASQRHARHRASRGFRRGSELSLFIIAPAEPDAPNGTPAMLRSTWTRILVEAAGSGGRAGRSWPGASLRRGARFCLVLIVVNPVGV
jgi:hypothetical protein